MRVVGPMEKARHYIESHSKTIETPEHKSIINHNSGPCITISRESGAGADEVSEKLIYYFQQSYSNNPSNSWSVFDKNLIEKVLQDNHLPKALSNLMTEKKYSVIKSIMNEILGGQPSIWSLVHKTTETILQLAQVGNCIILDRGANVITSKLKNTFHVRLVAPVEIRIEHVQKIFNIDRKSALAYIKNEDKDRHDFLMTYFHKDVNDPLLYHIVINTGIEGIDNTAKIICTEVINRFPEMFQIGD